VGIYTYIYSFVPRAVQNVKRRCRAGGGGDGGGSGARPARCADHFPTIFLSWFRQPRSDDLYLDKNPIILYNGRVARADASGINAAIMVRL
jgi:hypothetical protein